MSAHVEKAKDEILIKAEGIYTKFNQKVGSYWSFHEGLGNELSRSIRLQSVTHSDLAEQSYTFLSVAVSREAIENHNPRTGVTKAGFFMVSDQLLCNEIDVKKLEYLKYKLSRFNIEMVLSLSASRETAKSCSKTMVINVAKLAGLGIKFCLRNPNLDNDIHVMMLKCGFTSYVEINVAQSKALRSYFTLDLSETEHLETALPELFLTGIDNQYAEGVARSLPAKLLSGLELGPAKFY